MREPRAQIIGLTNFRFFGSENNNRSDPNKERSDAKNLRKLISVVLRLFGT